jgi:hypothetical protein
MKRFTKALLMSSVLLCSSFTSVSATSFSDVPSNHWASQAIQWAVSNKTVTGYTDGTFKPNKSVTEAEFITMLLSVYKVPIPTEGTWPENQYAKATELGYPVMGIEKKDITITRLQVAELVAAAQGQSVRGDAAIQYLLNNGLAKGKTSNTVEGFKGGDTLTRAEAVQFLINVHNKKTGIKPTQPPAKQPKVSYDNMKPDPKSRPAVEAFYNSIKVVDGKITGKMPQVPAGYDVYAKYSDYGNKKLTDLSKLKPGETFSLPMSTDAVLLYELEVNGEGKSNVAVYVPSMDVLWSSKPLEKKPAPPTKPVATVTPKPPVTQPKVNYMNMKPDPKSRPAVEAFYNSVKIVDGKITGKMPQVPTGYEVYAKYTDQTNRKVTDLSKLKPGQTFSLPVSTNSALFYRLEINGEGKNFVTIYSPSMDVTWSSKKQ